MGLLLQRQRLSSCYRGTECRHRCMHLRPSNPHDLESAHADETQVEAECHFRSVNNVCAFIGSTPSPCLPTYFNRLRTKLFVWDDSGLSLKPSIRQSLLFTTRLETDSTEFLSMSQDFDSTQAFRDRTLIFLRASLGSGDPTADVPDSENNTVIACFDVVGKAIPNAYSPSRAAQHPAFPTHASSSEATTLLVLLPEDNTSRVFGP